MTAIISTTYNGKYLYFLPIVTWCWNKLGVDVICFLPEPNDYERITKFNLVMNTMIKNNTNPKYGFWHFRCPEDKEATYAQCSRLYAACLDLPEDEVLVTSDVDMALFQRPIFYPYKDYFTVFGYDLVPNKQYPMCYLSAYLQTWRDKFELHGKTYQGKLDELLGDIDCDNMRGNYWSKDQEQAFNILNDNSPFTEPPGVHLVPRARPETQFAEKRYDRDDAYLLERLSLDTIDYHLPRPGYEENNFNQILSVLKFHYPHENFDWLIEYNNEYKKFINEEG